ncbi:hypothetical protein HF086_005588 [Spodoptera exigua]|uniref:Peroxidase n=1 Tax=Spodoptera exigua TaxID=7107 RepID=A0A922MXZ9_SPOEX|nr:hypothetical protein HF086_005588 [Spodoptera exigua]
MIRCGCCLTDWDLNFLTDDLFPDVSPLLASTRTFLEDLLKINNYSMEDEEESPISSELVAECIRRGRELSRAATRRNNELVGNGVSLEDSSPAMLHFFSAKLPSEIRKASDVSHEIISATKLLQMKMCSGSVTPNTFISFLEHQGIRMKDATYCQQVKVCCSSNNKYRTIDGTCNNKEHPEWGRRGAPFTRIATPRYADGIYAMPVAKSGHQLPNPRVLSTRLFQDQPIGSRVLNNMNMQWGQFVTHDLVFQVMEVTDKGGIQCCLGEGKGILPSEWLNDKCIPISVPDDDQFYRCHGIKCLNFVRSVTTPRDDCSLGHAEQMNTVTSYLDGSPIYGSDKKLAAKLRSWIGGRLRQESRKDCLRGFLPSVSDKFAVCDLRNSSEPCYLAGDTRINQTPTLAMLHTLLLREHNRVADILSDLNPLWSDEKLYQEARRIVIAEIQHITYQEWLPANFDLFVGGAMERDVYGSILGHTFQCIVAEQFYRTRISDRYFYDNGEMPHSFTSDQLKELKKASMARLICDNTDSVYYVQKKAFEVESTYNPKYRCDDYNAIPYVDLTAWKQPSIFD